MDIAAVSMALSNSNVGNAVSTALLSKSLDAAKQEGNQITEMIAQAGAPAPAVPGLGENINVLA